GAHRARRAVGHPPDGHGLRRAEDQGDGDHRRARDGAARAVRRRVRLPQRQRRHGHGPHLEDRGGGRRADAPASRQRRGRRLRPGVRVARGSQQAGCAAARRRDGDRGTRLMSRVLLIDNYDSFAYNLVQYLGELGAQVEVWRNDAFTLDEVAELAPDRIVVSPGPCTPAEAGLSIDVIRRFGSTVPILGVCLGHQAIGAAYGGAVVGAKRLMHGKTSRIEHDGSGPFAGLPRPLTATRYHSLVVEDLPAELVVNAWVEEDGGRVIMGVRHTVHPVWGVQFHPESILTEGGHELLANFLRVRP